MSKGALIISGQPFDYGAIADAYRLYVAVTRWDDPGRQWEVGTIDIQLAEGGWFTMTPYVMAPDDIFYKLWELGSDVEYAKLLALGDDPHFLSMEYGIGSDAIAMLNFPEQGNVLVKNEWGMFFPLSEVRRRILAGEDWQDTEAELKPLRVLRSEREIFFAFDTPLPDEDALKAAILVSLTPFDYDAIAAAFAGIGEIFRSPQVKDRPRYVQVQGPWGWFHINVYDLDIEYKSMIPRRYERADPAFATPKAPYDLHFAILVHLTPEALKLALRRLPATGTVLVDFEPWSFDVRKLADVQRELATES